MFKQFALTISGFAVLMGTTLPPGMSLAAATSAKITQVTGQVQAKTASRPAWGAAGANFALPGGSSVRTGQNSRAVIQYNSGTVTRMGAHTLLRIQGESEMKLLSGKTYIQKQKNAKQLKVKTPTAVAAVMGTTLFVSHNRHDVSHVTTLDGVVEVTSNRGEKVTVNPGEWVEIEPDKPLQQPTKFDWDELRKHERFLLDLDFVPSEKEPLPDEWH